MISNTDQVFLLHAQEIAKESDCLFQSVGAVLAFNSGLVSVGFNHTADDLLNCKSQRFCRSAGSHCGNSGQPSRALHAEVAAILSAYEFGKSPRDCTLYCTHPPCLNCLKVMAAAGVARVVYTGQPITDSIRHEFHSVLAIEAVAVGQ